MKAADKWDCNGLGIGEDWKMQIDTYFIWYFSLHVAISCWRLLFDKFQLLLELFQVFFLNTHINNEFLITFSLKIFQLFNNKSLDDQCFQMKQNNMQYFPEGGKMLDSSFAIFLMFYDRQ